MFSSGQRKGALGTNGLRQKNIHQNINQNFSSSLSAITTGEEYSEPSDLYKAEFFSIDFENMTYQRLELSEQKCRAISECWLPDNKILCGCDGNELVTVDFESDYVTIVNKNEIDGKNNRKFLSVSLYYSQRQSSVCFNLFKLMRRIIQCCSHMNWIETNQ